MSARPSLVGRVRNSDFVRHGLLVFSALMAANVLQFLFYSLVSRVVGVEQYGILTSLFSGILLLAVGPALVASTVVARLSADLHAVGDLPKLRRLGDVITNATAAVGAGAFGLTVILAGPIAEYLHLTSTKPVLLAGIALGLSYALPVQRGILQGTERFDAFAWSNIVEAGSKFVAGPLLGLRYGTDGVLVGLCVASGCSWCYNVVVLRRLSTQPARLRLDLRRIVITSSNVAIAVLAVNALLFYDVILVRHYFPALIVGLYGAASLVGRAVYTVIAFVPTIVLPKASARLNVGRGTGSLLAAALLTGGAIVACALVLAAVAPRLAVSVLAGRAFGDAGPFVFPYVFAVGILALTNVVVMYKIGLHRFDFVIPLAVVAVGEILAVGLWHPTIFDVLLVLCVGHSLSLATTLYRVNAGAVSIRPVPARAGD